MSGMSFESPEMTSESVSDFNANFRSIVQKRHGSGSFRRAMTHYRVSASRAARHESARFFKKILGKAAGLASWINRSLLLGCAWVSPKQKEARITACS